MKVKKYTSVKKKKSVAMHETVSTHPFRYRGLKFYNFLNWFHSGEKCPSGGRARSANSYYRWCYGYHDPAASLGRGRFSEC